MKTENVTVNNVAIACPEENGIHFVAIKPICRALGIDHQKQFARIKNDPLLQEVYTDRVYTYDQKGVRQPMFCLQLEYVFGWIFSIELDKVNSKAKPTFMQYKKECYSALYEHFYGKMKSIEADMAERKSLRDELDECHHARYVSDKRIKEIKKRLEMMDRFGGAYELPHEDVILK